MLRIIHYTDQDMNERAVLMREGETTEEACERLNVRVNRGVIGLASKTHEELIDFIHCLVDAKVEEEEFNHLLENVMKGTFQVWQFNDWLGTNDYGEEIEEMLSHLHLPKPKKHKRQMVH